MAYSFKMADFLEQALLVIAVMALLAGVIWYFALRRDRAVFEHAMVLNAPRERVFSVVNNLRSWSEWLPRVAALMPSGTPASKLLGAPVFQFEGPASGKGAVMILRDPTNGFVYRWEIIEATEPAAVVVRELVLPPASYDGRLSIGGAYPTIHRLAIEAGINSCRVHWVSTMDCTALHTFLLRVIAGRYQAQFEARLNALKNHVESQSVSG